MTPNTTALGLAGQMVDALSDQSLDDFQSCLSHDVRLRALVPSGTFAVRGAQQVADQFRIWFAGRAQFALVDASLGDAGQRTYARWRIQLAGPLLIEQHAFITGTDKVESIDLLCSGFMAA